MSSSSSSSPTFTSTASTSSTPQPTSTSTTSGIVIPTTTVVAIGAGFITFALLLLSLVIFIRFLKLVIRCKKQGRDWRVEWEGQGGTWGWLHRTSPSDPYRDELASRGGYVGYGYGYGRGQGQGGVGWMNSGVGGGGWYGSEMTRMRLWNERVREERGGYGKDQGIWQGEKPGLWEVNLDLDRSQSRSRSRETEIEIENDQEWYHDNDMVEYTPIAVGPTNKPEPEPDSQAKRPLNPLAKVRVSILIALPSPTQSTARFTDHLGSRSLGSDTDTDMDIVAKEKMETEMEMEIPEMVIGSMTFIPTIPTSNAASTQTHTPTSPSLISPSRSMRRKEGSKTELGLGLGLGSKSKDQDVEVEHVEVTDPAGVRGAEWVRRKDGWVIEGLADEDEDEHEKTG